MPDSLAWRRRATETAVMLTLTVLAACGGGQEPDGRPDSTAASRRSALATATETDALLDWAEQNYGSYFPSHRSNQFLAPYTYRHYPETGIYLGVAGDDVYVLGGPFGTEPLRVGRVSDFVPTAGARPAGTGNGCWDLDFMSTAGRHIVVESRNVTSTGASAGGMTQDWRVLGLRPFGGTSRLATETSITLTLPNGQAASVQRNTSYTQREGNAGVTIYGDEGSMTTGPVSAGFSTLFDPPWTDTQYSLEVGRSVLQNWSGTSTSQGRSLPLQGSRTIRFVARETLTVPAGTFETCRFEQTQPSTPTPMTTWIASGWGVPVQVQGSATGAGGLTQALRVTVDGIPIGTASSSPTGSAH